MKRLLLCVLLTTAACGGDKVTAPVPCDTYRGGIVAMPDSLPGTYTLTSLCQGTKPHANFTASLTIQGQFQTISGTYTTTGEAISVDLTITQLTGTFRLANDTLKVSGTVGPQALSLVGARQ